MDKKREKCLKETEKNAIKIGNHVLENSASEKYLGDKINKNGTAASITETIESKLPAATAKGKEIVKICDDPRLIGFLSAIGPINEFEF